METKLHILAIFIASTRFLLDVNNDIQKLYIPMYYTKQNQ